MLGALCTIFGIVGIDKIKIFSALQNEAFDDFEDCLQEECALEIGADYIITRNPLDFVNSRTAVIEPKDFLELIK